MTTQAWDEIVCNATTLIDRLDKNGYIFDSSSDDVENFKMIHELNVNKIDIMSMLYNIVNLQKDES